MPPSRSTTPMTTYALASCAASPKSSVAGPGTSTELSQYLRKNSRPSAVRDPIRAPKSSTARIAGDKRFGKDNQLSTTTSRVGCKIAGLFQSSLPVKCDRRGLHDRGTGKTHR